MRQKNVDLQNSDRIMLSSITSRVGNAVFDYANKMILVSVFANGPLLMSLYQSSETMIGIVFNLFADGFADKVNRKKILIVTDFLSGITLFDWLFIPRYALFVLGDADWQYFTGDFVHV